MYESVRLIISVVIAAIIVIICIACTIIVCVMFCVRNQTCSRIRVTRLHRDRPEQDDEESGETSRARDLSQAPPPAYRNANQYQNVDLEHTEVVKSTTIHRLHPPTNYFVDTTSLPPDYTSQRLSISVASQEIQVPEGQLPPTYSTAQLELMARRIATEQLGNSNLMYSTCADVN